MPANKYHFITDWTAPGATIDEVYNLLTDPEALPIWWPAVYLDVAKVANGNRQGIGAAFDLFTKGWLPYTLKWRLTVEEVNPPHGTWFTATGDFEGRGIWTLEQVGNDVNVRFDWKLAAEKPMLRMLSPILKPMFSRNHEWAMAKGYISLLRELERRRQKNTADAETIPAPPGPTTWEPYAALTGGIAVLAVGLVILVRATKKPKE